MIFRYYIIGNDGRPYEQSVNATTQAEAQRLANRFAQEDGTTLLTVPDTTTGTTRLVPEYYDNLNERTGISNVAGRSISLPALEAGGIAPILSPDDPALNPRNPITGVPAGVNVSNPNELTGQTFYGDVNTGYGVATPGMAGSRGTITNPFDYNPEFSAPSSIDTRTPVLTGREFEGDVIESGGPLFKPEVDEKVGDFDILPPPSKGFVSTEQSAEREFYNPTNYRREGYPGEVRLIREIEKDGTIYREYEFFETGDRSTPAYKGYFIVAPGASDIYADAFRFEYPITDEAFQEEVSWGNIKGEDFADVALNESNNLIEKRIFLDFAGKGNSLRDIFDSIGRSIKIDMSDYTTNQVRSLNTGEVIPREERDKGDSLKIELGDEVAEKAEDIDAMVGSIEAGIVPSGGKGLEDFSQNNASIEDVDAEFLDFDLNDALTNFLATAPSLGINLPLDSEGNPRTITAADFPGFPAEILDPSNLFIRVREQERVLSDPTQPFDPVNNPYETTTVDKVVPNPAVELLLSQYAQQIQGLTDIQGSADDILQAQVSATGGFVGGPAGSLSIQQLEDLERSTRSIQASGGRLVQERVYDDQGNPTEQFKERITPLAQADIDQQKAELTEQSVARQQRLAEEALRQSGGLLGGYYSPLTDPTTGVPIEGEQRFVSGFTPQQLLKRQEQEAIRQRQAELELVRAQSAPTMFRNIADIYSNPAQLAAIVASGGSPLLRGQLPGSPIQNNVQLDPSNIIGYADGQPIYNQTPTTPISTNIAAPPRSPINVDVSGLNEQQLRNLNPLGLATLQGTSAVQGIDPSELEKIAASNTPGGMDPLQGFGGTTTVLGY